jgi:hypothetical protein
MTIDRIVFAVAGILVLLSVILALVFNPWFLAIAAFVGTNMLQSAFTKFVPWLSFFAERAFAIRRIHAQWLGASHPHLLKLAAVHVDSVGTRARRHFIHVADRCAEYPRTGHAGGNGV